MPQPQPQSPAAVHGAVNLPHSSTRRNKYVQSSTKVACFNAACTRRGPLVSAHSLTFAPNTSGVSRRSVWGGGFMLRFLPDYRRNVVLIAYLDGDALRRRDISRGTLTHIHTPRYASAKYTRLHTYSTIKALQSSFGNNMAAWYYKGILFAL